MAAHNVLSKTDRALVAYLISIGAGTASDIYPGKRSLDKALPCTICYSERANIDPPYSGNYTVHTTIHVRTDPAIEPTDTDEGPKDLSEERVATTFDAFFSMGADASSGHGLAEEITAAAQSAGLFDFTIQDVTILGVEAGFDGRGNSWTDSLMLEMVVCPRDVR